MLHHAAAPILSMQINRYASLAFMLLALAACRPANEQATTAKANSGTPIVIDSMVLSGDTVNVTPLTSWSAFERFEGHYAYEIHLINQEPLHGRLRALLGSHAEDFTERYLVVPPITLENKVLFNEGCMPHHCLQDEAALAIDMKRDIIYVGIAENKQVTLWGENGDTIYPAKLLEWRDKFNAQ
ncbi:hypothetical protein GA0116948_107183 [Chitinophaga costaii]|uniref:Lipoprotein n=2 Tax=Chitinophaga costaii TaxID=1335309 RepID=A0A1C4E9B9_9BACT|nr:hypothetical protein GA0116948_107183 [Chitinophaga costaii]